MNTFFEFLFSQEPINYQYYENQKFARFSVCFFFLFSACSTGLPDVLSTKNGCGQRNDQLR